MGLTQSYPSLRNSLKALSLLDYFVTFVIASEASTSQTREAT